MQFRLAHTRDRDRRSGFTLIEIMIVVALIAFLASILIVALRGSITGAKAQATKATITKISGLMKQRTEAFNRVNFAEQFELDIDGQLQLAGQLILASGQSFNARDLATVIAKKYIYKLYFPQTWAEASTLIAQAQTAGSTFSPPSTITPSCESAEVLYWLLTSDQARLFGYTPEGTDNFVGATADTDGNGFLEIVDAWGHPIRWYRWPTRLLRPGGYGTATDYVTYKTQVPNMSSTINPNQDPDDPLESTYAVALANSNPGGASPAPTINGTTPIAGFEQIFHTLGTYYTPLVVSAGADGDTGLFEPDDYVNFGYLAAADGTRTKYLYDNITNLSIRSGGQ